MRTERLTDLKGCVPLCEDFDPEISSQTKSDGKEQVYQIVTTCQRRKSCQRRKDYMGEKK